MNDEYRIVTPGNWKEIALTIIIIWFSFVGLLSAGYSFIGSTPMKAYLTVADIYFKTQVIYQSIIEPFILGKGDKFVLDLYETGMVTYPTPTLIAYASMRAAAAAIVQ